MNFTATIRRTATLQAAGTVYYPLYVDDVPAAKGHRPDRLLDVSGRVERVQRHIVDQIVDAPLLPTFDVPVPQMVEQLVNIFSPLDVPVPEQAPKVPKISCLPRAARAELRAPLVEVPTVLSFALLQLIAEQNVGIPVGAGGRGTFGGLQGFLPGQHYALTAEQTAGGTIPGQSHF